MPTIKIKEKTYKGLLNVMSDIQKSEGKKISFDDVITTFLIHHLVTSPIKNKRQSK